MPCLAQRSFMKPLEPSSAAAAALGPKALMPAASSRSTSPATSGASGPTTTKSIFCSLAKADEPGDIVGGDGDAFGLRGDAGIARGAKKLGRKRRGGDRPAQRMLAAARSDHQNPHACLPLRATAPSDCANRGSSDKDRRAGWPTTSSNLPEYTVSEIAAR